ncbi:MAG: M20/M25/M40 family metallo-hydrolase [Bacteroidetes bacterium]|nr:MAG: M20/M25/M40 family metallo-hydrolase [Bacteroidota bacterium]
MWMMVGGLVVSSFYAKAQLPTNDSLAIKALANSILADDAIMQNLYYLTKKIGGRLAGSPQMFAAEKWGLAELEKLKPSKVFTQSCLVPRWVRGKGDTAFINYALPNSKKLVSKSLAILALGNSKGTTKPVQAPVVVIKSFTELEERKAEVKGKIVLFNAAFDATTVQPFREYGKNGVYRTTGASRAAKYGAVGVLVRSMSGGTDNLPHTGNMTYNDSFPKIPAAAVGLHDANFIASKAASNASITLHLHGTNLPDTTGNNIIAEITGSEFPNEVITAGGHLDSWDVCEGAHDDGAGVVQTIAILRAFKQLGFAPKHTIRFVLFANEENGTRGAKAYATSFENSNSKPIFALESDAGGFTPRGFGFTVTDAVWEKIQAWRTLLEPYLGDKFVRGGGGADIAPLNRNFQTPIAGLQPDGQRYFDHHHAISDTFEQVNKRELQLGAVNMAALLYLVDKYKL